MSTPSGETRYTAERLKRMADEFANVVWGGTIHTPDYITIVDMLRQAADDAERWEKLKAWLADDSLRDGHHGFYRAGIAGVRDEITQLESR
jgi:hypothetical protein